MGEKGSDNSSNGASTARSREKIAESPVTLSHEYNWVIREIV